MKQLCLVLLTVAVLSIQSFSQKKEEVNFSDPFQIDSSEYFLIPRLIDDENQSLYGKGKGYLSWGNYNDVYFYNSKTNQSKRVFAGQLALVTSFSKRRNYYYYDEPKEKEVPENILQHHIVYIARTDNFNGDNALDSEDPAYLYISTKAGENLRQITPKLFNVISWSVSKDGKMILVKGQNDKNGNKKFGNGDDQLYYRIDLHNDISKIQCYQVYL